MSDALKVFKNKRTKQLLIMLSKKKLEQMGIVKDPKFIRLKKRDILYK